MKILLMTVNLHLEGCQSLKEKRQRLAGTRKKLGRESFVAIRESGFQDQLQKAEWSIVLLAEHAAQASQAVAYVERLLSEELDARITEIRQEVL